MKSTKMKKKKKNLSNNSLIKKINQEALSEISLSFRIGKVGLSFTGRNLPEVIEKAYFCLKNKKDCFKKEA